MVQKNAFLAWPNQLFADEAFAQVTIGGGDWMPENPLSNLLDPRLSVPAVSTDVTSEGTQFWVDLGQSRRIKVFAMPWIRGWTRAGLLSGYPLLTVRARIYSSQSTASTLIYDSSFVDQHPVIFDRSTLPSTHPSFVTGRITPEDAAAFAWKQPWWHWIGSGEILGRHILFEIEASRSSLERIEIPYLIIAPGYQPTLNMQYGASLGVEDLSIISEAQSGAEFSDRCSSGGPLTTRYTSSAGHSLAGCAAFPNLSSRHSVARKPHSKSRRYSINANICFDPLFSDL